MKIFSGTSNKPLAEKIALELGIPLSPLDMFTFPDGEKRIRVEERVVDEQCIVVQSTSTPAAENYMELFFIVDALKRSGAAQVIVVMPYVGYQRQDHVFRDGEAVSLDVVVHALERSGAGKVIACDLHSIKISEIFSVPVVHLSALELFADVIARRNDEAIPNMVQKEQGIAALPSVARNDEVLVSPDMGGLRRIKKLSEMLDGMDWIATVKDRDLETGSIVVNKIEFPHTVPQDSSSSKGENPHREVFDSARTITTINDLKGRRAFIVDDMIASGKTIIESAKLLKKQGVSEVFAFATHAVFSPEAPELLQNSLIQKVFVTNSVFVPEEKRFEKLEIISIAEMVARVLQDSSSVMPA